MNAVTRNKITADFIRTGQLNGLRNMSAKLPASHPLIRRRVCRQIRTRGIWAEGWDELGYRVLLCEDAIVRQFDPTVRHTA